MKKILLICSVFLAMVSCQEDYELNLHLEEGLWWNEDQKGQQGVGDS